MVNNLENKLEYFTVENALEENFMVKRQFIRKKRMKEGEPGREGEEGRETETERDRDTLLVDVMGPACGGIQMHKSP